MPSKEKKLQQIVEIVQRQGRSSVRSLSEQILTSEMTIRRYLNELEEKGALKRVHGGAVPVSTYVIGEKKKYLIGNEITKNVESKSAIGFYAASLINDNETVGFDIGTTVPFIAKYLRNDISINAICVTFECALEIYHKKNTNMLLPGGYLDRDTDLFRSDEGITFLSKIRTDKVFLSTAGIDKNLGLTCYNDFHVTIKKLLMQSSNQIILVADSTKFGMVSPSFFGALDSIHTIITDDKIPLEYKMLFEDSGVEVIIAK